MSDMTGCVWCKGRTLLDHDCRNFAHLEPVCDTCGGTTYLPMPPEAAGSFGISARCPDCPPEFCPHGRHLRAPCGDCTMDKFGPNDPWPQPHVEEPT